MTSVGEGREQLRAEKEERKAAEQDRANQWRAERQRDEERRLDDTLYHAVAKIAPQRPEGYATPKEVASVTGVSPKCVYESLRRMDTAGRLEFRTVTRPRGNNRGTQDAAGYRVPAGGRSDVGRVSQGDAE